MSRKLECNFFLVMNEDGEWEVAKEHGDAACDFEGSTRAVYVTVFVSPPETEEVEIDVPDDASETATGKAEAA